MVIMAHSESWGRGKLLGRFGKLFGLAWRAFRMRGQYDLVVADVDHVGGILALMLKLSRSKVKVVTICHGKLSRGFGARAVHLFRLHRNIQHFVCYGKVVADRLHERAGIPEDQIHWVEDIHRVPEQWHQLLLDFRRDRIRGRL